jgi:Ala-tRNA(Pro) deacylase
MPIRVKEVEAFLDSLGVKFRVVEHAPVFTVDELVDELKDELPVKNLLLTNHKDRVILVTMPGFKRLDLKDLESKLQSGHLSFASPTRLKQYLDVESGSVSVFGLLNRSARPVELIVDRDLMKGGRVGWHPNDNTKTVVIDSGDVETVAKALTDNYRIIDL